MIKLANLFPRTLPSLLRLKFNPRQFPRRRERPEQSDRCPIQRREISPHLAIRKAGAFSRGGLDLLDHLFFIPASPLAEFHWVELGGAKGGIESTEMTDGRGVKAGVVGLKGAAAYGLAVLGAAFEFKCDRIAIPMPIAGDVVGVESGGMQGALPFAE